MALTNLGAATRGGTITEGQDTKEATSNDLDNLIEESVNSTHELNVGAGGTFNLNTPQGNLDIYLGHGLIRLIGAPGAPTTIVLPDGDRRIAFENVSGQATTITTVTGASPPVSLPTGSSFTIQVRGTNITIGADDSTSSGAMLADGTVAATGDFDWANHILKRALLVDYAEASDLPASAASMTLNYELGNLFEAVLDQNTTLVFSNPPVSGTVGSFTLIVVQDGTGGWVITWPTSVDWEALTPPTLSNAPGHKDVLSFFTRDGGVTWYGFLGGVNFG